MKAVSKYTVPVQENIIDPLSTAFEYRTLWLRFSRVVATSQLLKKFQKYKLKTCLECFLLKLIY